MGSMFGILEKKTPYKQEAKQLYAQALQQVRLPAFYTRYGVADTMEARFDLLLLHLFLIIERNLNDSSLDGEAVNQALFDITFADMDQTLREMGIGDMGVPKRMRKMMTGFNGRMHRYDEALKAGSTALSDAIAQNVYASAGEPSNAQALANYTLMQHAHLRTLSWLDCLQNNPLFVQEES